MEDEIIPSSPQNNPAPNDSGAASDDMDNGEGQVFDITDDLNISPAIDPAPAEIPVKPAPMPKSAPSVLGDMMQAQPKPAVPASAIPNLPIPPRKPVAIPLADFSASLEKAKTISSANPSSPDFGQQAGRLPTEIGKDPVAQNPNLKPLRTYEGDVAEVLAHNKTSTASIAIAEAKKQGGEERMEDDDERPSHLVRNLILALLSLLLIGGGIAVGYYFYSNSPLADVKAPAPAAQTVTSLIPADSQEALSVSGLTPTAALSKIQSEVAKTGTPNTITEIIPIQSTDGQNSRVTARDMLSFMEIAPPDILTRSLDQNWMLGMYADASGNRSAFVVVSTNFFQNAFAGMLQWENVMPDDLKQYLIPGSSEGIANIPPQTTAPSADTSSSILPATASSTAASTTSASIASTSTDKTGSSTPVTTSTAASSTFYSVQGHFVDKIIMNKDVRAFQTGDGRTLFLYSFIDNTRLVVAGNEAALSEILTRLEKEAFVR